MPQYNDKNPRLLQRAKVGDFIFFSLRLVFVCIGIDGVAALFLDFNDVLLAVLGRSRTNQRSKRLGDFALLADDLAHIGCCQNNPDDDGIFLLLSDNFNLVLVLGELVNDVLNELLHYYSLPCG